MTRIALGIGTCRRTRGSHYYRGMACLWGRTTVLFAAMTAASCGARQTHERKQPTADEVVQTMLQTYQRVTSYEDRGVRVTEYLGAQSHTIRAPFETTFVRPDRFRFEIRNGYDPRPKVIWIDQGRVQSYFPSGAIENQPNLMSANLHSSIPALLLPAFSSGKGFAALERLRLDGAEAIEGHACWRVIGVWPASDEITLWIDQTTYMLRRTASHHHFEAGIDREAFDTLETTNYEPTPNKTIEASRLRGPDPANVPPPRRAPWIGIELDGVRIVRVISDSPAALANLETGDEVVSLDGVQVADAGALIHRIQRKAVGEIATLEIRRAGAPLAIAVTVGDLVEFVALQRQLVNQPAPLFAANSVAGTYPATSKELAGNLLVLDFTATVFKMCDECGTPATFLSKLQDKYGPRGLRVVSFSKEEPAILGEFATEHQLHHTLAYDPDSAIANAYRAFGPSTIVIVDRKGLVRFIIDTTSGLEPLVEHLLER